MSPIIRKKMEAKTTKLGRKMNSARFNGMPVIALVWLSICLVIAPPLLENQMVMVE